MAKTKEIDIWADDASYEKYGTVASGYIYSLVPRPGKLSVDIHLRTDGDTVIRFRLVLMVNGRPIPFVDTVYQAALVALSHRREVKIHYKPTNKRRKVNEVIFIRLLGE